MCEKKIDVPALFGKMVFGEQQMQQRLPAEAYRAWQQSRTQGTALDRSTAGEIAAAMKDWAIENGATHYTHWFQPMTGFTAEKHDSFITRDGADGVRMELSAKELNKGEADASSFPSGGLRATFEARGYTAWDPTSYAFIKDNTLYIPTIFCSYSGQTLDKKTPLLRSMRELDRECIRILRLFGNTEAQHVIPQVGPEQEYFLIDRKMYDLREDLKLCGRTLFGAKPPKGQELDDHYYGAIKPRVAAFMRELDEELWKLGVLAKTEHNEVAPAQHEIAPIYSDANSACDKNQLTMELLKKVAARHGLVCLLHEKPFAGINGSGKHDNWSLQTDTGENLLKPGGTPSQNAQFLLFLAAFIKGVDEYQEMLRCCVSYPGNDHRLGGNEAPPAIISVFLGDELTAILDSIVQGTEYVDITKKKLRIGVDAMPDIPQDTTDRNRTSPLAFTGNKFEFRMLGSSQSIASPNVVLNTIMADELKQFADRLEKAENFHQALQELLLQLGYSLPKYGADGAFGSETEAAVLDFQKDQEILQDGKYGSETHAALMDAVADDDEGRKDAPETEPAPETPMPAGQRVMIVSEGGKVNIRAGNGTQYARLSSVAPGTTFEHIATAANGWHAVPFGNRVGWVSGSYAQLI